MTRILIIGGTGFIGRHLAGALIIAGHAVTAAGRRRIDLVRDSKEVLASELASHSVVINAAGLVQSHGANTMTAVHAEGTERLVSACQAAGVRRLIHLSALGAKADGATSYQRSKGQGERALLNSGGPESCILRPSVVIGGGGASTGALCALAALPLIPRLGPGTWTVQPVHVDDLAALVVRLAEWEGPLPSSLDVVGPEPMTTDELIATLRSWLGLPRRPVLPVPEGVLRVIAWVGERMVDGPINREILTMLRAGNSSDPASFAAALGRMPLRLDVALAAHPATQAARQSARMFFIQPLLRISIALMWIITGLLSFGLYPLAKSYALMAQIGLTGLPADAALYGGAALDTLLGLFLLIRWRPVAVGAAQLALMAAFTLLAARLPAEYWLHPFAPLVKNLPIAAATLAMMALEG